MVVIMILCSCCTWFVKNLTENDFNSFYKGSKLHLEVLPIITSGEFYTLLLMVRRQRRRVH